MTLSEGRRAVLRAMPEARFRDQVRAWAERRSWTVYFTWNSRNSPSGFPDLVMVRPPRLLIVELKKQKAPPPTPSQRRWLELLERVPCVEVHIWRPWDEPEILEALR